MRINKENQQIEEEMKEIIKRLDEVPESIEEMDSLRFFCRVTLEEELNRLKLQIDQVMRKLDLLEVFFIEISEEDFFKTWSIYGMPLEMRNKRDECLLGLKLVEIRLNEGLIY